MPEQMKSEGRTPGPEDTQGAGATRDNEQEDELEAEQESAAAMDSDVPQPPGADSTTEGQPS
ncbi:MAG TPA: hypothetical protein VF723_13815 [Pyrinomonadaceae bacterium]|jgi:hypothetical protein